MNKYLFSCEFPSWCGLHLVYALPFQILVCGFRKREIQVLYTLQCHVLAYSQIKLILAGGKKGLVRQKRMFCLTLSQYSEDINECCFILIKNMQMA